MHWIIEHFALNSGIALPSTPILFRLDCHFWYVNSRIQETANIVPI